jgi:hypothetical protein
VNASRVVSCEQGFPYSCSVMGDRQPPLVTLPLDMLIYRYVDYYTHASNMALQHSCSVCVRETHSCINDLVMPFASQSQTNDRPIHEANLTSDNIGNCIAPKIKYI